ncbi:MAG: DUF1801 domain-containing protein [Gemmatimonadota bacterium]
MAVNKTQRTTASVPAFLKSLPDPERRKDAKTLAMMMRKATGVAPAMWGPSIVGYGDLTYQGSSGRTVDWFLLGFASRSAGLTVYLMGGLKSQATLLKSLGRHKVSGGCLHIPRFADVDVKVLERIILRGAKAKPPRSKTKDAKSRAGGAKATKRAL